MVVNYPNGKQYTKPVVAKTQQNRQRKKKRLQQPRNVVRG